MKKISGLLFLAAVGTSLLAGPSLAAEGSDKQVTLTGRIACAACVLKLKDVRTCTNVLVVSEAGKDVIYALEENQVTQAYEMKACEKAIPVKVTGAVVERTGKRVVTPTRIERG